MSFIPLYMFTSFPNISVMFLFRAGGQYGKDDCSELTVIDEFQQGIKLEYELKDKQYFINASCMCSKSVYINFPPTYCL
jgi:hypothetical protein